MDRHAQPAPRPQHSSARILVPAQCRQPCEADQIEAGACANSSDGTFEIECATRGIGSRRSLVWSASQGWWWQLHSACRHPQAGFACRGRIASLSPRRLVRAWLLSQPTLSPKINKNANTDDTGSQLSTFDIVWLLSWRAIKRIEFLEMMRRKSHKKC